MCVFGKVENEILFAMYRITFSTNFFDELTTGEGEEYATFGELQNDTENVTRNYCSINNSNILVPPPIIGSSCDEDFMDVRS